LGVDRIIFTATFSGIPHQIYLPPSSILAIYAQENGKGIYLTKDEDGPSNFNSVSSYGRTNFMEDRKPKIEQRAKKERVKLTLVDSEPKEY
jgi:stringent starvation protein B